MKVGAVLLVKDEIGLLRKNIEYHRSIGVDCFVICDRGSSDESQRRLEELARRDDVHLFRQHVYKVPVIDARAIQQIRLAALRKMRRVFAPDWLFPADTDEFWVPAGGSLKRLARRLTVEQLDVGRYNAALEPGGVAALFARLERPAEVLDQDVIVGRRELSRAVMAAEPEVPWVFHAVMSKFLTSGTDFVRVDPGFHDVHCARELRRGRRPDLLILHLPFTTWERFENKVQGVVNHLRHVGPTFRGEQAWHWRRWAALAERGELRAEFDRQFFAPELLADLRRRGVVASIREHFRAAARDRQEREVPAHR